MSTMTKQERVVLLARIAATPRVQEDPAKRERRLARMRLYTPGWKARQL